MNNPLLVNPINQKLQLSSSANVPLGAGVKVFQVNTEPKAEIQTCDSVLTTTGAKYCADATGTQIALNAFCVLTNSTAKTWEVFSNTAGYVANILVVGVNANNDETTENVVTNGTTAVNTVNTYKFINDISVSSGSNLTASIIVTIRPSGGTPQDQRITLSALYKINWGFMCSNKNGKTRKARLRSINSLYNTTATSNFTLHVFKNNATTGANLGISRPAYRLYDSTTVTSQGITFADDGTVEVEAGELCVWYRESATTTVTGFSTTWSLFYTN